MDAKMREYNETVEAKLRQFEETVNLNSKILSETIVNKKQFMKKILELEEETQTQIENMHAELYQQVGLQQTASFLDILEEANKKALDAQSRAEAARDEKDKLKTEKAILTEQLASTKRDIEQIVDDNHKIEAQINDTDHLPTILKLMSSNK